MIKHLYYLGKSFHSAFFNHPKTLVMEIIVIISNNK